MLFRIFCGYQIVNHYSSNTQHYQTDGSLRFAVQLGYDMHRSYHAHDLNSDFIPRLSVDQEKKIANAADNQFLCVFVLFAHVRQHTLLHFGVDGRVKTHRAAVM